MSFIKTAMTWMLEKKILGNLMEPVIPETPQNVLELVGQERQELKKVDHVEGSLLSYASCNFRRSKFK